MVRFAIPIYCAVSAFVFGFDLGIATAQSPILRSGDTLALVGGTFIERMQSTAALENELQCRRPDWQLRVRNLGWSGDDVHGVARKVFESDPQRGFERLMADLKIASPTIVMISYGFAEASNGKEGIASFGSGLRKLVQSIKEMPCRVVLLRPFVVPGIRTKGYQEAIDACVNTVDVVAKETDSAVVSAQCNDWSDDRLVPSESGYESIGVQLADQLVGERASSAVDGELNALIIRKNELFFHRHRPQNETYLLLFRKHEQGNNAVELPQFDPLVDELDQRIWQQALEK